jgi:uncharacterized protein (DUF1778 family)
MSSSEAMKRAVKKYNQEKVQRILMRVPMGKKEVIQAHAASCGESLNAFLNRAVDEAMKRDNKRSEKSQ